LRSAGLWAKRGSISWARFDSRIRVGELSPGILGARGWSRSRVVFQIGGGSLARFGQFADGARGGRGIVFGRSGLVGQLGRCKSMAMGCGDVTIDGDDRQFYRLARFRRGVFFSAGLRRS